MNCKRLTFLTAPLLAAALSSCGTSNVEELKKRGPEYTLTSKMSYENLGECVWQIRTKRTGGPGVLHHFNNVNTRVYRISYLASISFGSQLNYVIEMSPHPQNPSESLVTVYALRGLIGNYFPKSLMQDDITQCETYSNQ